LSLQWVSWALLPFAWALLPWPLTMHWALPLFFELCLLFTTLVSSILSFFFCTSMKLLVSSFSQHLLSSFWQLHLGWPHQGRWPINRCHTYFVDMPFCTRHRSRATWDILQCPTNIASR
jgi:hypothetical protein